VALDVRDARHVPWLSVVLGFGPMVPLVLGAVAAWALAPNLARSTIMLTRIWGGAILAFLSGVRRGFSFRTSGGAQPAQIATMMGLFVLALASLVLGNLVARVVLLLSASLRLLFLIQSRRWMRRRHPFSLASDPCRWRSLP
jgi:hypothetical protein